MYNWKQFFKDKKITVMGLGLLGRGVGDAVFLAECGAKLTITDLKTTEQLKSSLAKLKKFKNVKYTLGEHKIEDFRNADFILKAAGVPLSSLFLDEAKKNGVPVYMSTALFAKFAKEIGATIVGITGTRGKSTVTHLIYHILKKTGARVHIGGNVKGISTLAMLPEIKKGDMCVLELDSWQLQGFGNLKISPQVAVFTNLLDDHLNYYPDKKTYFADKSNIFTFQNKDDVLVAGKEISNLIKKEKPPVALIVPKPMDEKIELNILGAHNRENAALAAAAAEAVMTLGVDGLQTPSVNDRRKIIIESLKSFQPVEGRLQFLRKIRGVSIYNDNNATTPDATIAALRALSLSQSPPWLRGSTRAKLGGGGGILPLNIILICGGTDKGLDMSKLVDEIPKHCKATILLKESGTEKLKKLIQDSGFNLPAGKAGIQERDKLRECIETAMKIAKKGDIILFSPAFASFGKWFKNEYDRGEQFVRIVDNL